MALTDEQLLSHTIRGCIIEATDDADVWVCGECGSEWRLMALDIMISEMPRF